MIERQSDAPIADLGQQLQRRRRIVMRKPVGVVAEEDGDAAGDEKAGRNKRPL